MGRKQKTPVQRQIEVLSARVNIELYRRVQMAAKHRDLNMTQVMRQAIREWLERYEAPKAA